MMILIAIPFILVVIATFIFLVKRIKKVLKNFEMKNDFETKGDVIIESLCMYIFPGVGLLISNSPCDVYPFGLNSFNTSYTLWILFALAHLCSRFHKGELSPVILLIVSSGMIMGVVYCAAICIHFSSNIGFAIIPFFQLFYLSPLFCLLYLSRELYNLNFYLKEVFANKNITGNPSLNSFYKWLGKYNLGFSLYLLAPIIVIIQSCLYLVGQRADSIIYQFTDSCGYLLSYKQSCSCGGDHYLCSIAANGAQRLVKPIRMGIRQDEKILVNRQLLIANAFENWLEDYTPCFHRIVRKTYDSLNIPVNAWSKHKHFANILYILMKPLELSFLLFLYVMDKKPENRIARQYLPKKELNQFIKEQNHEKNNH